MNVLFKSADAKSRRRDGTVEYTVVIQFAPDTSFTVVQREALRTAIQNGEMQLDIYSPDGTQFAATPTLADANGPTAAPTATPITMLTPPTSYKKLLLLHRYTYNDIYDTCSR